jgi:chaperonin GroES
MAMNSSRLAIAWSSNPRSANPPRPLAWCCRKRPKRSRRKAKSSPSAQGRRDEDGKRIKMDVEVGDIVLYAKYGGTEVKIDDKKLY